MGAERPIVVRGLASQIGAAHVEHLLFEQLTFHRLRGHVVPNALEHLAEDEIRQRKMRCAK